MTSYDPTGGHAGSLTFYNPGPVWVRPDVLQAQVLPMMSHRSKQFVALYAPLLEALPRLFRSKDGIAFTMTGSATSAMEGALRSLFGNDSANPGGKILYLTAGAFAERWHQIAGMCGVETVAIDFGWGKAVDPQAVKEALAKETFAAVALVHNETSTGTIHPLAEVARLAREMQPEALVMADCVTSLAGAPVLFDEWGLDLAFAGSQKAMALPPGMAVVCLSKRAHARAKATKTRGSYLDFVDLIEFAASKQMTPATPALTLLAAMALKLRQIEEETLEARWDRHARQRDLCRSVLEPAGFTFIPAKEACSPTVSAIRPPAGLSGTEFTDRLKKKGWTPGAGYGKFKESSFRIGHMGDGDDASLAKFLDACVEAARG